MLLFSYLISCQQEEQAVQFKPSPTTSSDNNIDNDGDGVLEDEDCDDQNPNLTYITEDNDCDGIHKDLDCDDSDNSVIHTNEDDSDCDLVPTAEDCDDSDPLITNTNTNDFDCDLIPTSEDCDDNDPLTVNDMDCDGINSAEDLDDNSDGICDGYTTTLIEDTDCDGNIDLFYLASNGVTIICDQANIGEAGIINEKTYIKRDRTALDDLIEDNDTNALEIILYQWNHRSVFDAV